MRGAGDASRPLRLQRDKRSGLFLLWERRNLNLYRQIGSFQKSGYPVIYRLYMPEFGEYVQKWAWKIVNYRILNYGIKSAII